MTLKETSTQKEEFKRLLLKTPLGKFTDMLYLTFMAVSSNGFDFVATIKEAQKKSKAWHMREVSIAKQLLSILKNKQVKIGKTAVTSTKAIEALKACLIEEYHNLHMDYRNMTLEEAECYLDNWRHDEDTKKWLIEESERYYETPICDEKIDGFIQDYPEICQEFADICRIREEITPEQVEGKIKESIKIVKSLSKQGRKPKNLNLMFLILEIRKYYKGKTNKDYRLIFDCMNLFGLIDNELILDWQKKYNTEAQIQNAKASYIKTLYNDALRYESPVNSIKAIPLFEPF